MLVREKRKQSEDGDELILNLGRPMSDVLRKRVDFKVQHTEQHDGDDDHADHDIEEDVGLAWSSDESGQVMRRQRVNVSRHDFLQSSIGLLPDYHNRNRIL